MPRRNKRPTATHRVTNRVFDQSFVVWRELHAADPCSCGHRRGDHFDANGGQRQCRAPGKCPCASFSLEEVAQA